MTAHSDPQGPWPGGQLTPAVYPEHHTFTLGQHQSLEPAAYQLYLDVWESIADGDLSRLASLCDPEYRLTLPGAADIGMEAMLGIVRKWHQAFSNFGLNRDDMTVFFDGEEKLATRDRHKLTHDGPFTLPDGTTIPATGKTFTLFGAHFVRVRRNPSNGPYLVVRWDIIYDRLSLLEQIQAPDETGVSQGGAPYGPPETRRQTPLTVRSRQ